MRGEKIMPSTQNAVNNHEYRSVPITALAESATNPRKRFDAKSLEELAASFKTQGILAPLLVRELEESKYEVVAGARRLRAAKLAELEKLPVRVVKLTDAQAIEAQCVENLQREDIAAANIPGRTLPQWAAILSAFRRRSTSRAS